MAFIYEVNGQKVEFEKEPTEKDIDEAAKSLRPAPESRQPKPVEGQGGAAFGVYRPQGRRPDANNDREASKDMPIQTARGVVTGALGGPSDLANLPGVLYGAATGQESPYTVPYGSEQWNQMLPFQSDTPQAKLARFGGEVMAPFPSVKAIKAIPGAVRGAGDVVSGAYGAARGNIADPGAIPQPWQTRSVRQPVGTSYYTPEDLAKWRSGEVATGAIQPRPIENLGPEAMKALQQTQGNVPFAGQGMRAFGESLGQTYRNPLNLLTDVGLDVLTSGGLPTAARLGYKGYEGYKGVKAADTLQKAGFSPMYPEEMAALKSGMPHPSDINGPIVPPNITGVSTPAAQAAMATTRAKVASTQPRAQPQPFTMPTAQETFNAATAARPSHQTYEAAADAVAQRTKDILKQARIEGRNLSPQAAANQAEDEIRAVRFPKKSEAPGPKLAQESETPALVKTPGEGTLAKPNVEFDRTDWFALQEKVRSGKPLTAGDQSLADKITGRYGPDPFGSGDLTGSKMFNTVAQGETTPVAAVAPTPTAEMPVIETPPKRSYIKQDDRVKAQEAERTAGMTPEQIAAEEQANLARMNRMAAGNSPLQRALKGEYSGVGSTPKTTSAPKTAKELKATMTDNSPKMTMEELQAKMKAKKEGKSFFEEPPTSTGKTPFEEIADEYAVSSGPTKTQSGSKIVSGAEGIADYNNKTITLVPGQDGYGGPDFRYFDKDFNKAITDNLPKNAEWVKEVQQWDPTGKESLNTTYYTKATKNSPAYKLEDNFIHPDETQTSSKLYKDNKGTWELVADEKSLTDAKTFTSEQAYKDKVADLVSKTLNRPVDEIKKMSVDEMMKVMETAAQTKLKSKSPPGTMKMETGDNPMMSKKDWNEKRLMDELAGKPTLESYIDNGKAITHKIEGVGPFESVIRTEFDAKTGKQIGMAKRVSMKKVK
jgi:hypothetical protein